MENQFNDIPKEKFRFASGHDHGHDEKFETKRIGYFRDAFRRFCHNKSSVAAAVIILCLLLFAFLTQPIFNTTYTKALTDTDYLMYQKLLPKIPFMQGTGFWDGTKKETMNVHTYNQFRGVEVETGLKVVTKIYRAEYQDVSSGTSTPFYDVRTDTYTREMYKLTLTGDQYRDIMRYQDETGIQVIFPAVSFSKDTPAAAVSNPAIWYEVDKKGNPKVDADGNFTPSYRTSGRDDYTSSMRVATDPYWQGDTENAYRYAVLTGTSDATSYGVRVSKYNYFQYKYGYEPYFVFGTTAYGQDLLTRLASGAQFSFMLAIFVSAINLVLGTLYGAVEGYFGGATDLVMERISDVLSGVPFMVVVTLFQLHLARIVGPVVSLLFAFVLTGWIGTAHTVRTQFYRFKHQEYVLAARTLGAKNKRLMFKHIFPNALGTIITSSVLVIPSVIFSESTLTYLGIVNLESSTMTSVGTLLSGGQSFLSSVPHIILFPAIFISLLMISFNLFGNGLRDAFNPSLRGVEE